MLYIFFGLLFVFIDWPVALWGGTLDVVPNVVGYLLALYGASTLKGYSKHFQNVSYVALALAIVSAVQTVISLLGISSTSMASAVISILATIAFLYLAREITEGAKAIEARQNRPIGVSKLITAWGFLCVGSLLAYLPLIMPDMFLTCSLIQLLSFFWFEYSLYLIHTKSK